MRPRREEGAESTTARENGSTGNGSAPATETSENVAAGTGPQPDGVDHQQPLLETWPVERGLETASLAPFAGEAAEAPEEHHQPAEHPVDGHAGHHPEPQPAPTAEAEQGIPFVGEVEHVLETTGGEYHPAPRPAPTPEAERGRPFVAEAERVLEPAGAEGAPEAAPPPAEASAEPPPRPADNVLEITEKPANPRRGWWQRLIQQ
jgi:hypothetical protein